jgi:nitrate reductase assembly molybdenum cofactor insertion protein NarJ
LVAAGKADDAETKQKLVNDARKHVKQLTSTLSREDNPFAAELKLLQERLQ